MIRGSYSPIRVLFMAFVILRIHVHVHSCLMREGQLPSESNKTNCHRELYTMLIYNK